MSYDHNKKAGNQGDVVKHVALVAALDTILKGWPSEEFRYADAFAGYPKYRLLKGNEWEQGISKLVGPEELMKNVHVKLWSELCLPSHKSELASWSYPGSSWIAIELCKRWSEAVHFSLWETSTLAIAALQDTFPDHQDAIYGRSAEPKEEAVQSTDFLFVDPPGLGKDKGYPEWKFIREFLVDPKENRSILLWLPVNAATMKGALPREDKQSEEIRKDVVENLGFHATKVRWAKGGRTIGCQLIYHLPEQAEKALRKAVEHVVDVAGWRHQLEVLVVVHYPEQLQKPSSDTSTWRLGGLSCC